MFDLNANGVQMIGVVNALKTGNPQIDTMLAVAIPFLLSTGLKKLYQLLSAGSKWWLSTGAAIEKSDAQFPFNRVIVVEETSKVPPAQAQIQVKRKRNEDLVRAIQLYVYKNGVIDMAESAIVELNEDDPPPLQNQHQRQLRQPGSQFLESLKRCEIFEKMPTEKWHLVGSYGNESGGMHPVKMRLCVTASSSKSSNSGSTNAAKTKVSTPASSSRLELASTGPNAISIFIDTAFKWYLSELAKKTHEYQDRYLYDNNICYRLSDEKTFESLFSQHCRDLIKIVDHFQNKTGKYAIKGYPHKLGLMLHGPPGTGKTSLIKALAHRTGRSIVSLNLSVIKTNAQLQQVFFQDSYYDRQGLTTRLGFSDKIFVLEDLDADSSVVKRRKPPQPQPQHQTGKKGTKTGPEDTLNLSGLLNALDGVVDTPGRMLIITTNHPEQLDPALVRPGRIDKILELGYMKTTDIVSMIEHYFEEALSAEQISGLEELMQSTDAQLTPAVIEQITIENDDVAAMLKALEKHVSPTAKSKQ